MTTPNAGFILREDAALKAHLQGIKVTDSNSPVGGRAVPVYYRLPEQEARRRDYPYVTIDLITVARDPEREHRGTYVFGEEEAYTPPGREPGEVADTDWPIPMLFTYQVTQFARFVQHDRQIMAALLTQKLPVRFGAVAMTGSAEFPDDNSMRRLEFVSGPTNADSPDPADPNKRIFRKAYTVQMSSELLYGEIRNYADILVDTVHIDLHDIPDPSVTG